ncbi:MAG: hypothetical protein HY361_01035, partial [Candidatus Aenigmarchaeota archaeon]|nr:hypothetical protein [Candidatus Aenigmarchaeota archaeon]
MPQSNNVDWISKIEKNKENSKLFFSIILFISFLFGAFSTYYLIDQGLIKKGTSLFLNFDITIPFYIFIFTVLMLVGFNIFTPFKKMTDIEELAFRLNKLADALGK